MSSHSFEVVEVYVGSRMNIRVVKNVGNGVYAGTYRVQYQYSKKNDTWLNYIGSDFRKGSEGFINDGNFETLSKARATARRALRNNNW